MFLESRGCLMDEIKDSTLSEEIDRLQAEHRRYAQRLDELIEKPYLSEDEQLEEVRLEETETACQGPDLRSRTPRYGDGVGFQARATVGDRYQTTAQAARSGNPVFRPQLLIASKINRIIVRDDGS